MTTQNLKDLIVSNKLKQVLAHLKKNNQTSAKATLIEARLQDLKSNTTTGVLSDEAIKLEKNQIRQAILDLVEILEGEESSTTSSVEKISTFKKWRKEIIAALVTIVTITGFTLKDFLPFDNSNDDIDLTVFIRGHEGKSDLISQLNHKAQIIVDFGNKNIQPKTLGDLGGVSFEGIPSNRKGKKFMVMMEGVEDFELANPDSQYIFKDEPVYVTAHRVSLIKGTVQELADDFIPIANAKVIIDRDELLMTKTSQYGKFEIKIPQHKSKERHEVLVEKEGYKTIVETFRTGSAPIPIRMTKIN